MTAPIKEKSTAEIVADRVARSVWSAFAWFTGCAWLATIGWVAYDSARNTWLPGTPHMPWYWTFSGVIWIRGMTDIFLIFHGESKANREKAAKP
jgi:hypothetical protein